MERLGLERLLHTHLVAGYSMAALQTVWEGSGTGVGRGGEKVGGGGQEEGASVCTQTRARARTHTHLKGRDASRGCLLAHTSRRHLLCMFLCFM